MPCRAHKRACVCACVRACDIVCISDKGEGKGGRVKVSCYGCVEVHGRNII